VNAVVVPGSVANFAVHYGAMLKLMTAVVVAVLLGTAIIGVVHYRNGALYLLGVVAMPLAILLGTFACTVLRYEVSSSGIDVVRPIGRKRIAGTVAAIGVDDDALKGAIRTFGNGGLFSFNGYYRLAKYGSCRLWVTDLKSLVVIHGDHGCVVVSPAERARFVALVAQTYGVKP
jgi:hypothetical protein